MQNDSNLIEDPANCLSTNSLHEKNYSCISSYVETLLQEANLIIIQIDNGNIENTRANRNYATWRLQRVEKYLNESTKTNIRKMLNSLWSQLYRLEHSQGDLHPFILKIRNQYDV